MMRFSMAAALFVQGAPAEPPLTLGQFLALWDTGRQAGVMARMSPEARTAARALRDGARRYRARVEADKAAGRPPQSCPPPRGSAQLRSDDVIPKLEALPASDHAKPFETVLIPLLDSLYPCPAA